MGLLSFLKRNDINFGVEEFKSDNDAVLLDVRTPEEYNEGHIEGSINLPLGSIVTADSFIETKNTPVYVYCLSGRRSGQAVAELRSMGYTKVKNIGGIASYQGKVVV